MLSRSILLLLAGIVLTGCSADNYRREADAQVESILKDRKEKTLAYQPASTAPVDVPTVPVKKAYAKIPATRLSREMPATLEPPRVEVPYGQLGPPVMIGEEDYSKESSTEMGMGLAADDRTQQQRKLGPPVPRVGVIQLDLFRSLAYAVQHSRTYETQMEELYLAALEVTLQRHLLSPRPFTTVNTLYTGGQEDVNYRSALSVTTSAGVRQRLPYGGEIVAQALVGFVHALDGNATDGETAALVLSGSVPLLRGAGLINLEPLINSERQVVYQVRAFENFRRNFLVDVSTQYFTLLTTQQGLNNRRVNYFNLALLTERTQALYDAGRISFLEVQRSLQAQLTAENSLVTTQQSYQTQVDNFKVQLGMPIGQEVDIVHVELDVTIPDMSLDEAVALAMQYRLELQTAQDQIEDAQRSVQNSKNGLLPDLDLTGDVRAGNPLNTPASDVENRTLEYSGGLSLDLPIDRVAERNIYRRSLVVLQRSQRAYEELRDRVSANARDSLRQIQAAQISLDLQRAGTELAQRRLDFSNELLRQGKVSARDVVEAQSSLLDAQDAYDRANAQLQIQVLRYLRETGTLRVDPQAGELGRVMDRDRPDNRAGAAQ